MYEQFTPGRGWIYKSNINLFVARLIRFCRDRFDAYALEMLIPQEILTIIRKCGKPQAHDENQFIFYRAFVVFPLYDKIRKSVPWSSFIRTRSLDIDLSRLNESFGKEQQSRSDYATMCKRVTSQHASVSATRISMRLPVLLIGGYHYHRLANRIRYRDPPISSA
jgi:hypothetical protein